MERRYEIETLRRSLAMLTPQQMALNREKAIALVEELQDVQRRLEALRAELRRLADEG
jgi:ubiquinone biosynthesis protein UbiJ